MNIKTAVDVEARTPDLPDASGVTMRMLIGPAEGAPTFNMRLFEVAPGGHTPCHSHDWEHEVYVLGGAGEVRSPDGQVPIAASDCVLIPPNEEHQFVNTGDETLKFLCLVPRDSR